MNPTKAAVKGIALGVFVCLLQACSKSPDPATLKQTLLCEGDRGVTPYEVRCEYFYLDGNNYKVKPEETVLWTLDIALEGIPQRFYSQTTGDSFTTVIDRPGDYTLTAANAGNKSTIDLNITEPVDGNAIHTRQVPFMISSGKRETQEHIIDASAGSEITGVSIEVHPNTRRVSSRVSISEDRSSARLVVEFQPRLQAFKNVVNAWFAGNVVLMERKLSN